MVASVVVYDTKGVEANGAAAAAALLTAAGGAAAGTTQGGQRGGRGKGGGGRPPRYLTFDGAAFLSHAAATPEGRGQDRLVAGGMGGAGSSTPGGEDPLLAEADAAPLHFTDVDFSADGRWVAERGRRGAMEGGGNGEGSSVVGGGQGVQRVWAGVCVRVCVRVSVRVCVWCGRQSHTMRDTDTGSVSSSLPPLTATSHR